MRSVVVDNRVEVAQKEPLIIAEPRLEPYRIHPHHNVARKPRMSLAEIAGEFHKTFGKFPDLALLERREPIRREGLRRVTSNSGTVRRGSALVAEDRPPAGYGPFASTSGLSPHLERDRFPLACIVEYTRKKKTPLMLFDIGQLERNYNLIKSALAGAEIYYPVKTNDHPSILSALHRLGSGFEAASWGEIEELLELGVNPSRIIYGAPIKPLEHISAAYHAGVRLFAYDSPAEIPKLAKAAPGCMVYLRISTPEHGSSVFPLSGKFGANPAEACELLLAAARRKLVPCGLSFHVGSQCIDPWTWWVAIALSAHAWNQARKEGLNLSILNIGGGIPITYCQPVPDKEVFLSNISLALKSHFQRLPRLFLEPGRCMVGDIAVMVTTIIGKAHRDGKDWIYVDAGIYSGLVEVSQERERFSYEVCAEGTGDLREYSIGGPTCDCGDIIAQGVLLPEVDYGNRMYILNTGAYSNVCVTSFNGFPPPEIYCLEQEEEVG